MGALKLVITSFEQCLWRNFCRDQTKYLLMHNFYFLLRTYPYEEDE